MHTGESLDCFGLTPNQMCEGCRRTLGYSAAALGRLGGKAGTGETKVRGDSAYYKALRAKRTKPQKAQE